MLYRRLLPALVAITINLLTGCAAFPHFGERGGSTESHAKLLGDMPLPRNARFVAERSLILDGGVGWIGRAIFTVDAQPAEMFSFFRDRYPVSGWSLLSSMQGRTSILILAQGERILTVEIAQESMFGGQSTLTITAAPKFEVARDRGGNERTPSSPGLRDAPGPFPATTAPVRRGLP